jgi:hypothetical protein
MLILSKKRKFRIFQLFFTHMTLNDFLHQHKSTKFDTGFRMVHKLSYLEEKKFLSIFSIRGDPYQKKVKNFFFLVEWKFIHQSKAYVKFSRFLLV